jgi:hypothetical protein
MITANDAQFDAVNKEVARAADKIERAVADMLKTTLRYDYVALDYVAGRLLAFLLARNPGRQLQPKDFARHDDETWAPRAVIACWTDAASEESRS